MNRSKFGVVEFLDKDEVTFCDGDAVVCLNEGAVK